MKYLSSAEIASKWGISQRRVALLCAQGRIRNAVKTGKTWIIPEIAEKPEDERFTYKIENTNECDCVQETPQCSALCIDTQLLQQAAEIFAEEGTTASDAINLFLYNTIHKNKNVRIGIAKGKLTYCDDIDFCNDEIADMFGV